MADPQPEPDPRLAFLKAATINTAGHIAKITTIAKGAINELASLRDLHDDLKKRANQLEEEAKQHADLKKEYEGKIAEQKSRLFEVTSTLYQKDSELGEKDIVIEKLQTRLYSKEEENKRLQEKNENLVPKPLVPMSRKPVVVVDLEEIDTDDELDLENNISKVNTTIRATSAIVSRHSKMSKLKRQTDTRPSGDKPANNRLKRSTSLQTRTAINLVSTLTQDTIKRVKSRFIEANIASSAFERHKINPKILDYLLLEFLEPFDVYSSSRFDRVRAIARLHNANVAQSHRAGISLTEIQSWKQTQNYKAEGTPLQVIYNWYYQLQTKAASQALRIMVEHFGRGIVVLMSPTDLNVGRTMFRRGGQLERALKLLLSMEEFGPAFKQYCILLERHIGVPIMQQTPIYCDLSATGQPLIDLLQRYDQNK